MVLMISTVYFASHRHAHVVKVCEFSGQIQMGGTNSDAEELLTFRGHDEGFFEKCLDL